MEARGPPDDSASQHTSIRCIELPIYVLALVIVVPLLLSAVVARIPPLVNVFRRWSWSSQRAEARRVAQPPSAARLKRWWRLVRVATVRFVRALAWPILALRLRVEDFQGSIRGRTDDGEDEVAIDGASVAATVRVAILRAGATGRSTPLFVSAPFSAAAAFSDVASAVSEVPGKGKLAAAIARLLSLVARLLGRDELVLSGRVLSSTACGPGVALLIAHANGRVIDSRILWAEKYEVDGHAGQLIDPTDRLRRVAVAAAVWAQFTMLRTYRALTDRDYEETIGTTEWESYAYHLVATRTTPEHVGHEAVMRALFAHAVDCDPRNMQARFNLAMDALGDPRREESALEELKALHDVLERRDAGDSGFEAADQFHFQVSQGWAAMALERLLCLERSARVARSNGARGARVRDARPTRELKDAWSALTQDLLRLESALKRTDEAVTTRWGERWASSLTIDSGAETVRIDAFMRQLEGRMLAAWASIAFHLERLRAMQSQTVVQAPGASEEQELGRAWLIARFEEADCHLVHEAVVRDYLLASPNVLLDESTHYNLACYFADRGLRPEAERELGKAMGTGHRRKRALADPQLARYRSLIAQLCDGRDAQPGRRVRSGAPARTRPGATRAARGRAPRGSAAGR